MLGKVLTKSKSFFPSGWKLKTGSLIKGGLGQTISIPENVIPLSLKVVGHIIQEDRNNNAYAYVKDNAGKELLYFAGMGNYAARDDAYANTTIDLMNLYDYDFDTLKLVTSFKSTITGTYNETVLEITSWLEKFGGGVIDSFLSLLKFLRKSVANMLGKIFTQPLSFFPPQYKYKLGTLSLSELDGNKYIPLAINIRGAGVRNNNQSPAKTVFKDNNGKELAYITNGPCGSYSQNTYWIDENMTIDLLSIYKADFENLKTFRNVTMTPGNTIMTQPSFNIVSWLEKVGS